MRPQVGSLRAGPVAYLLYTYKACIIDSVADELSFDWDKDNLQHIARHGITPDEIEQVFGNEPKDIDFDVIGGEERWTSIGHTNLLRVLIVIWSMRDASVRPITAFEASKIVRIEYIRSKGF